MRYTWLSAKWRCTRWFRSPAVARSLAEGLLDDQAGPARGAGQAGGAEAGDGGREGCRRQRQVEDPVAGEGVLRLDGGQAGGEGAEVAVGGERGVVEAAGAPGGRGLAVEAGGGQGLPGAAAELLVAQVAGCPPRAPRCQSAAGGRGGTGRGGACGWPGRRWRRGRRRGAAPGRGSRPAAFEFDPARLAGNAPPPDWMRQGTAPGGRRLRAAGAGPAWYSQASNRASRSAPLISSARAMNSAVDPLP